MPILLVATWGDGLFVVSGTQTRQELAGRSVSGLVDDRHGGVLAIVDGHSLQRRFRDGEWAELVRREAALSCCVPVGDAILIGTDDARICASVPTVRRNG